MSTSSDDITTTPHEGVFDAQLSFDVPFVEAPAPIAWILKRDGREAPFEQRKIADAIFKAANAIGGEDRDRANSLARGVTIYLAKHLNGAIPTVDQVHDAVEKVLIEMGHARTALAYVRYRDRRARLRKLRSGDVSAILKELDEARQQRDALGPMAPRPLFVRTSDKQLAGWDRERIVQALVREARMPERDARLVAGEVEVQVTRAGLTTLTAALVRELVDAKLVELGLERFRARHLRLGVPLHDAEQIICTPNQGEMEGQQDPASTDVALAQRVKREFALSAVHSAEVTEAHVRGDIHLRGLSQIDRLYSAAHSLDFLARFGLAMYAGNRSAPAPVTADALIAQASRFSAAMQRHFVKGVRWRGFNESLSRFLRSGFDAERIARLSLFGLMTPDGAPPVSIELRWQQSNISACMFALQFGAVWGAALDDGNAFGMPQVTIPVNAESLGQSDFRAWLDGMVESRARRACARIVFERQLPRQKIPDWPARDVVGGMVTLNLPRAAFEAPDEDALCGLLSRRAQLAFDALAEKKHFLERLLAFGGVGPLAALAFRHDGDAYVDAQRAQFALGVTGLNECAQIVTGAELHRSAEAVACAQRILQHLCREAEAYSRKEGIRIVVGADDSGYCARRFAMLDLQLHADAARCVVKADNVTRDAVYTAGIATGMALDPSQKLRVEGELHGVVDLPATARLQLDDANAHTTLAAGFFERALTLTRCGALEFQ